MTPLSVRGRVRGVMMRGAGRSFDDGITGTRRTVVTPMLSAMMPAGRLEVLGLVIAARAASQDVRTAARKTRPGTAAPLQFLQLGAIILRAAGHTSSTQLGHTCRDKREHVSWSTRGEINHLFCEK